MKRVLVDASAFFAVLVKDDDHHAQVARTLERASAETWELVTTNAVVFETYALLQSRARAGRRSAASK